MNRITNSTRPPERVRHLLRTRGHCCEKADTFNNVKVTVAYSPESRKSESPPRKRHKSILHAVVVRKSTMLEESLASRRHKKRDVPVPARELQLQKRTAISKKTKRPIPQILLVYVVTRNQTSLVPRVRLKSSKKLRVFLGPWNLWNLHTS